MKNRIRKIRQAFVTSLCCGAVSFGGGYAGARLASPPSTVSTLAAGAALSGPEAAAIIQPSVVSIVAEEAENPSAWSGARLVSGAGSGVICSPDGYILTCAHVVSDAGTLIVTTADGREHKAVLIGSCAPGDIAVIRIRAAGLTAASPGDSDLVRTGETVYAVGNPGGTLNGTMTEGIISTARRTITIPSGTAGPFTLDVIQTSAAVSPGNSGGGLFNARGQLIGIINAKRSGSDEEGLGFAIPINTAIRIASGIVAQDPGQTDPANVTGWTAGFCNKKALPGKKRPSQAFSSNTIRTGGSAGTEEHDQPD